MSAEPPHDEVESSRAPLLEHLVELRKRLIICVIALGVGFAICFYYSQQIYVFLLHPFEMGGRLLAAEHRGHQGPFDFLLALIGLREIPAAAAGQGPSLIYTAPLEFFLTKVKLAVFGAVVLTFPVLAWQLYRFVAPGLYKRERRAFLPFLLASPVLFLMGAALVYYIMLPFVLWFSLNQQIQAGTSNITVQLLPRVSEYLTLVTTLLLAFGLCFQLPVVMSLVAMAGLISSKTLSSGRRYAIVGVFIVAAILTPPDPISQFTLAIPICLLYEVSIWCVRLIEMRRGKAEAAENNRGVAVV